MCKALFLFAQHSNERLSRSEATAGLLYVPERQAPRVRIDLVLLVGVVSRILSSVLAFMLCTSSFLLGADATEGRLQAASGILGGWTSSSPMCLVCLVVSRRESVIRSQRCMRTSHA